MITLELYKKNWNTKYLSYNPEKWRIEIRPDKNSNLSIYGRDFETGKVKRSFGPFNEVSLSLTNPPEYCKSDVEKWD